MRKHNRAAVGAAEQAVVLHYPQVPPYGLPSDAQIGGEGGDLDGAGGPRKANDLALAFFHHVGIHRLDDFGAIFDDCELKRQPDLRRGQPHSRRSVHGLDHVRDQLVEVGGSDPSRVHGFGIFPECRMSGLNDGTDHAWTL